MNFLNTDFRDIRNKKNYFINFCLLVPLFSKLNNGPCTIQKRTA